MATEIIQAQFTSSGAPATGLSPTLDGWEVGGAKVLDAVGMTETGGGTYYYTWTSYDVTKRYAFIADGTATLGATERYVFGTNAEVYNAITALNTYDPPTRTEATSDKDAIVADIATMQGNVTSILEDTGTTLPATLSTIAGYLDTEIAAILTDTGTTLPAQIAALNNITVANILAGTVDGSETVLSVLRYALSVLAGLTTGGGTTTRTFKDAGGTKARVTATLDNNGNRTAITLDGT